MNLGFVGPLLAGCLVITAFVWLLRNTKASGWSDFL